MRADDPKRGYLPKRIRAFRCAFVGLYVSLRDEPHAKIHLLATVIVIALGLGLQVSKTDWLWLTMAITSVWTSEAFNAAIERLADRITLEHDPQIGTAKDIAAGTVLMTCLGAAVIGAMIFLPKLVS
ncbi:MAG: diacylglycerol kinase family protein [Phycisphaeraceae bacterium JB051]